MIYKETAMKVRQHLGELLNKIQYRHDSIVITKADKPIAALIDIELFDKIKKMKAEFDRLTLKFSEAYHNTDTSIAELEINEAIKAVRRKKKKNKE